MIAADPKHLGARRQHLGSPYLTRRSPIIGTSTYTEGLEQSRRERKKIEFGSQI